jgi:HlyD family secretion protein
MSVPLAAVTTRNPKGEKTAENNNDDDDGPRNRDNQNTENKPVKKEEDKIVIFVNDNGTAKMVEVKTGISDFDNIEILSGVSDSTEVITGPFLVVTKRIKDGEKIRKAEKKDEPKKEEDK